MLQILNCKVRYTRKLFSILHSLQCDNNDTIKTEIHCTVHILALKRLKSYCDLKGFEFMDNDNLLYSLILMLMSRVLIKLQNRKKAKECLRELVLIKY